MLNEEPGIAVDSYGNVVAADWDANALYLIAGRTGTFYGRSVRQGHIYVIAGTGSVGAPGNGEPAIAAGIEPQGVAVDRSGNLIVTDIANDLVRVIANSSARFYGQPMTAGHIYTVARRRSRPSGLR